MDLTPLETWDEPCGSFLARMSAFQDKSGRFIYKCVIPGHQMQETSDTALNKGQILELFKKRPEFPESL